MEDIPKMGNKTMVENATKEKISNGSHNEPTSNNNLLLECIFCPIRKLKIFFLELERRDILVMTVFIIIFVQNNLLTSVG